MKNIKDALIEESYSFGSLKDLDPLLERIGKARIVLLGEATHGTSDFYILRSIISQKLITERGFSFIAVEGDWPECYLINRYIKGYESSYSNATKLLANTFESWPTWMWANQETAYLIEWLKRYNQPQKPDKKIGFYGLDVYSLWSSLKVIIDYLNKKDPDLALKAKEAFRCFEPYKEDLERYGLEAALVPNSCETEVVDLLQGLKKKTTIYHDQQETLFNIEQNARTALSGERYYRSFVFGGAKSWNTRDNHMDETLESLLTFYGPEAKAIVWAHNSHVGDARYSDLINGKMINLGQRVREHQTQEGVVIVGLTSYEGSVLASDVWGEAPKKMLMPPAMVGSWEDILNETFIQNSLLIFNKDKNDPLAIKRPQRAIGVVYDPLNDRESYIGTVLSKRYDALIFLHKTSYLNAFEEVKRKEKGFPKNYIIGG